LGEVKVQSTFRNAFLAGIVALATSQSAVAQSASQHSEALGEGRELYNENCAICHGPNGDGRGSLAPQLSPRPRDFTKGSFKFRSTGAGQPPAAADLLRTITHGIEGSYGRSMPAFHNLSFDQMVALVAVIKDFAEIEDFGVAIEIPLRPDTASAERGLELFIEYGCIECHGTNGNGLGVLAENLLDDDSLPIRPTNFQVGVFKGGSRPEDIWMRLQTGLDGTPMPSFGRNLSVDDSWSLVDYVLELSKS
jgi:cytochrome c oxidase cbb3-type subunit 2